MLNKKAKRENEKDFSKGVNEKAKKENEKDFFPKNEHNGVQNVFRICSELFRIGQNCSELGKF